MNCHYWLALISLVASLGGLCPLGYTASPCDSLLKRMIHFDHSRAHFISAESPINSTIAIDFWMIRSRFPYLIRHSRLNSQLKSECLELASSVEAEVIRFFQRALSLRLDQDALYLFHAHYFNVLSPWTLENDREWLRRLLHEQEARYLDQIYSSLLLAFQDSPSSFPETLRLITTLKDVRCEPWNPGWSEFLKRDPPAAFNRLTRQIALRPDRYDPVELQIFLIHELAHLSDTKSGTDTENEIYAWQTTLDYLSWMRARNQKIPIRFLMKEIEISEIGLERWVRLRPHLEPEKHF